MTDGMQKRNVGSSLELRLFSSCLNTHTFLDSRSLERKKGKNPQLSPKHIRLVVLCENNKHSRSSETLSGEKIKIPKGTDNVV